MTKPGDVDHFTRVRCYEAVLDQYPAQTTALSASCNLAMRMAGPREAVWHAHHPQEPRLHPHDRRPRPRRPGQEQRRQGLLRPLRRAGTVRASTQDEIGIEMVDFKHMVYVQEKAQYYPANEVPEGSHRPRHLRHRTAPPPARRPGDPGLVLASRRWSRSCADQPPRGHKQGFTVFFTGLSGSGKSTIANALMVKLMEMGGRPVTLLDGDVVRKHLSSELGFSQGTPRPQHPAHRLCRVARSPRTAASRSARRSRPTPPPARAVREMIEAYGAFVEVHVATPLEECERRDRKGLYKLARAGKIKEFTGISDPYEAPDQRRTGGRHRECRCRPLRPSGAPEAGTDGPDQGLIPDKNAAPHRARPGSSGLHHPADQAVLQHILVIQRHQRVAEATSIRTLAASRGYRHVSPEAVLIPPSGTAIISR